MIRFITKIYDYMHQHKLLCGVSFIVITAAFIIALTQLKYKEDISDFLPMSGDEKEALAVYQDISGANRIFALFSYKDNEVKSDDETVKADSIVAAIDAYNELITSNDSLKMIRDLTYQIDLENITEITNFIYSNIPYFLTEDDYHRMDSLLNQENFINEQLINDKQMLMFPSTSFVANNIQHDPLNLYTNVVSSLQQSDKNKNFETYDGYIFTKDQKYAIVMMTSPFGNSETQNNTKLVRYLEESAQKIESQHSNIDIHVIGGPIIAVGNASQIKYDSILSVSIAIILILILLIYAFRRVYHIALIAFSIIWGWLFAMGMLAAVHDDISLIVVGISSVILGIAVNYPLHLIAHLSHTQNVRQALREVSVPLIIGNITTVGAFMALIPLKAIALRDLGLFSAFLLIGTILFVIIYLPHAIRNKKNKPESEKKEHVPFKRLSNLSVERKPWLFICIIVITLILGWFSLSTGFDANISHINYMTDEQREDMAYFQKITTGADSTKQCIYVVSTGKTLDEAADNHSNLHKPLTELAKNRKINYQSPLYRFLCSKDEQKKRIEMWNGFINKHKEKLNEQFTQKYVNEGFAEEAFEPYFNIINGNYKEQDFAYFAPLKNIYASSLSIDSISGHNRIVDIMLVNTDEIEDTKSGINELKDSEGYFCFDVKSMNGALANNLSDNFNYIGWACGLIVFLFLWFSFGNIELASLSFLPMAISWIWILGIMGIFGIEFNIVNIILATFIFGQGDDYTIFITEGCCYEYAYRRKMLASYKSSIIISALIMFIGIGTLIFAKHPALHSLAQITIIGMFSVVLMAYTLPPIIFNWMVKQNGKYRRRPITISALLRTWFCGIWWLSQLFTGYIFGGILYIFGGWNNKKKELLKRFVSWAHRVNLRLFPGMKYILRNPYGEDFSKPSIIICNHQSMLDPMCLMALSHKILIVANEHSSRNPITRTMFKWLGFYTIYQNNFQAWQDSSLQRDIELFRDYVKQGYSIAIFPEGMRNPKSSILRYHRGPFYLAHELGVDILPIIIHGMNNIFPIYSFMSHPGKLVVSIKERINSSNEMWGETYNETTKNVHRYFIEQYSETCKELEDTAYFRKLVIERYMYKGADILRTVKSNMKKFGNYSNWADKLPENTKTVIIKNSGLGEFALITALTNPEVSVIAYEDDEEMRTLAFYSAEGLVENLKYLKLSEFKEKDAENQGTVIYDTKNLKN